MVPTVREVSSLVAFGCLFFCLAEFGGEVTKSFVPRNWRLRRRLRKGVARFLLEVLPTLTLWGLMGGIALASLDDPLAISLFALSGLIFSLTPWPKKVKRRITDGMVEMMAISGVFYCSVYAVAGFLP